MSYIQTGEYIIINKSTGKALDANADAAQQVSYQHKRPFMWDPNHSAANHKWFVERQPNGTYMLMTRYQNNTRALDGNVKVPQKNQSHPAPFLWNPTPSASNHRWHLNPADYGTFLIVNEANGLALDGNVSGTSHHDHKHQAPFLWAPHHNAPNHQWIFQPVQNVHHHHHHHHHGLASGKYLIVNKATGQALDGNVGAAQHVSYEHRRPFMWTETKTAPNHHWDVRSMGNDEYMLVTTYSGEYALDGNTNVPQKNHSHPAPFLWSPSPSARNHRWRLVPAGEHNTFYIVNCDNGKALDGNVNGTSHHDSTHRAPFLWTHTNGARNHMWEFKSVGSDFGTSFANVVTSVINAVSSSSTYSPPPTNYQPQYQPQQPIYQPQQQYPPQQQSFYQPPQQYPPYPQQQNMYEQPIVYQQPPQQFHHTTTVTSSTLPYQQPQISQSVAPHVFQGFLESLKRESFESNRKNLVSSFAAMNFFTCEQLVQIFNHSSFSSEKLHAASVIVPKIVDKHNSHMVISALTFSSEKEEVTKLFNRGY